MAAFDFAPAAAKNQDPQANARRSWKKPAQSRLLKILKMSSKGSSSAVSSGLGTSSSFRGMGSAAAVWPAPVCTGGTLGSCSGTLSKPVAMTVTRISSSSVSSKVAPKM